jgi:hypothetical protein
MAPTASTGYVFAELMMWHNPGHVQVVTAAAGAQGTHADVACNEGQHSARNHGDNPETHVPAAPLMSHRTQ